MFSDFDESAKKHEANGNGKSADERKEFGHERAQQRLAEARELAKHRPRLSAQKRLFYEPPRVTPDVLKDYEITLGWRRWCFPTTADMLQFRRAVVTTQPFGNRDYCATCAVGSLQLFWDIEAHIIGGQ